jgi:hypothetical protein
MPPFSFVPYMRSLGSYTPEGFKQYLEEDIIGAIQSMLTRTPSESDNDAK